MNTIILKEKIEDIISLLKVFDNEAAEIEVKRVSLENNQNTNTQREKRLNDRDISLTQREQDVESQKKYIEESNITSKAILTKIEDSKKELTELASEKREIEKEKLQLEIDKKSFEELKLEKDKFEADKLEFEKERQLFAKEKLALVEQTALLAAREKNIKVKEDSINRREGLINV